MNSVCIKMHEYQKYVVEKKKQVTEYIHYGYIYIKLVKSTNKKDTLHKATQIEMW